LSSPPQTDSIPSNLTGRQIGRYEVGRLIGRGGMGAVYLGFDPFLGRKVALKFLASSTIAKEIARERFFREARAIARLEHPNIVRIYEAADDPQLPFIAMEFVDGVDAKSLVKSRPPLAQAVHVMAQVFAGLAVAHEHGVVHRDVKPANVLVTEDGTAKLIDFGLARLTGDDSDLTRGQVFGTLAYMSPEQTRDSGTTDYRTDIYAAGAMLFQFVTGNPPFAGATLAELMVKIVNEPVPDPISMAPDCPPDVASLILRCLAKAPEDRPDSARPLAAELFEILERLTNPGRYGKAPVVEPPVLPPPLPPAPSEALLDQGLSPRHSSPGVLSLPHVDLGPLRSPRDSFDAPPERPNPVQAGAGGGLRVSTVFLIAGSVIATVAAFWISYSLFRRVQVRAPTALSGPAEARPASPPAASPKTVPEVGPRLVAVSPPPGNTRLTLAAGESFRFRVDVTGNPAPRPRWRLNDAPVADGPEYVYDSATAGHRDLVSVSVGDEAVGSGTVLIWYVTVPR
jgi:serine/threonine protein kinase